MLAGGIPGVRKSGQRRPWLCHTGKKQECYICARFCCHDGTWSTTGETFDTLVVIANDVAGVFNIGAVAHLRIRGLCVDFYCHSIVVYASPLLHVLLPEDGGTEVGSKCRLYYGVPDSFDHLQLFSYAFYFKAGVSSDVQPPRASNFASREHNPILT